MWEPSWPRLHGEFGDQVAITYVVPGLGGELCNLTGT